MTVGIGLDHSGDGDVGADNVAHGAVIASDLLARYENVRAEGRH
jgi:hypothetical protein